MAEKKTVTMTFDNIKEYGWHEIITELKWKKFEAEHPDLDEDELSGKFYDEVVNKTFRYGEFGKFEIIIDEDLNIIGGKIIPCGD